jgi:thiamine biosynthesis lipoprotein ApbE
MPLDPVQAVLSHGSFNAMGTDHTVIVDEAAALPAAMDIVRRQFQEIDLVCSRFRPDSELSRLNGRSGGAGVPLSLLLEQAIVAALDSAAMTGGLVDLTVGRCVEEIGYALTFRDLPADGPPLELHVRQVVGWRALGYDPIAHTLSLPAGVGIDLGASGKAWAADRAAAAVASRLGVAVLVNCGGDIAVGGPALQGGWPVRVAVDADSDEWQDVVVFDGGLATSGTTSRRWRRGGVELHHIIDPSTGLPAQTPWAMVSVAAASCVEANAASTAALIMGERAPDWLDSLKLPARLVDKRGGVIFAGGWCASAS